MKARMIHEETNDLIWETRELDFTPMIGMEVTDDEDGKIWCIKQLTYSLTEQCLYIYVV